MKKKDKKNDSLIRGKRESISRQKNIFICVKYYPYIYNKLVYPFAYFYIGFIAVSIYIRATRSRLICYVVKRSKIH